MSNFVGFKLSEEHDAALLKLAGERQASTGERVDKSVLLREAVAAYLMAQPLNDFHALIDNTVDAVAKGEMTHQQATEAFAGIVRGVAGAARMEEDTP